MVGTFKLSFNHLILLLVSSLVNTASFYLSLHSSFALKTTDPFCSYTCFNFNHPTSSMGNLLHHLFNFAKHQHHLVFNHAQDLLVLSVLFDCFASFAGKMTSFTYFLGFMCFNCFSFMNLIGSEILIVFICFLYFRYLTVYLVKGPLL